MNLSLKQLANRKWFVPLVIFILLVIALSSLVESDAKDNATAALSTEKQLEDMCNAIYGVKNAKVMITYESVMSASFFDSENHTKEIKGIAVICEGGGNPNIQLELYKMIEALFGLPSTRITISERSIIPLS